MSTEAVTLYLSPQPTRSARTRWAFFEADASFEEVSVDIFKGEHKAPTYLEINPLGLVPAARIGDEVMVESSALALWVAMQHPDKMLLPTDPQALRDCLQWLVHAPAELDCHLNVLNQHTRFRSKADRDPALAAEAQATLSSRLERISGVLKGRDWLAGDAFSIADVVIGHSLAWAQMIEQLGTHPVLVDYLHRLEARDAFAKAYGGPIQTFPDPHAGE